jgi:photosystem II stability/assembly factor-like uncharacterized protein
MGFRTRLGILLFINSLSWGADSAFVYMRSFGGSGGNRVTSTAADANGNVIVAGTTTSFDFPVTNGSVNRGTSLAVSVDSGRTWQPLGNLPSSSALSLAVDSSSPPMWYAGGSGGVFRSADGGQTWKPTAQIGTLSCRLGDAGPFCGVTSLAIDPVHPATIYAGTNQGIYRSDDGGESWASAADLPNRRRDLGFGVDYLAIDPFHPSHIFTASNCSMFRSFNGGQAWEEYTVPFEGTGGCIAGPAQRIAFDTFTPDVVYQAYLAGVFRSQDGGVHWESLHAPMPLANTVIVQPAAQGAIYATMSGNGPTWSLDGGVTWHTLELRGTGGQGIAMAADPFHGSVVLSGNLRTEDAGANWTSVALGRGFQRCLFDPQTPGRVVAIADTTNDAFVAKLDPNGNILFATYFGGQGSENNPRVATDAAGNIYLAGTTSSPDLPATTGTISDDTQGFVAKFDPDGKLVYSMLLPPLTIEAIAADASGSAAIAGTAFPKGFPDGNGGLYLAKLAADGSKLLYAVRFGGHNLDMVRGVAVDRTETRRSWGPLHPATFQ